MLSFPPQNDNFFSDRPGVLEKTDPGDGKPAYSRHLFEFPAYSQRFSFPVDFLSQTHVNIHQLFEPPFIRNFVYSK